MKSSEYTTALQQNQYKETAAERDMTDEGWASIYINNLWDRPPAELAAGIVNSGIGIPYIKRIKQRIDRAASCEYWKIAIRKRSDRIPGIWERVTGSADKWEFPDNFIIMPSEKYVNYADPFLYEKGGKTWLFYERQDLTDMKGSLWCRSLYNGFGEPIKVLEEDFHLSYPQVFDYGEHTYMLPETRNAGEVRLYRAVEFPDKWEYCNTLMLMPAVDSTVFIKNNVCLLYTYWEQRLLIFRCRLAEKEFRILEMEQIYESPENPDMRPGGGILQSGDGSVYRPVQVCRDCYGGALDIKIQRDIQGLWKGEEPGAWIEEEAFGLEPGMLRFPKSKLKNKIKPVGVHTYNCAKDYEVIDFIHKEKSAGVLYKKLRWKLMD